MKPHGTDFELGEMASHFSGWPGSWLEPGEPPFYSHAVKEITFSFHGGEDVELTTGQLVEFSVEPDGNGWNGSGYGRIKSILSITDREIRALLSNAEITYVGPTPAQSQRGRG